MQVRNPKALAFFLKYGVLATMREYPYKEGQKIIINGLIPAEVRFVFPAPFYAVLKLFSPSSGFNGVDEWMTAAKRMNHKKMKDSPPRFMVFIERVKEKGGIGRTGAFHATSLPSHPANDYNKLYQSIKGYAEPAKRVFQSVYFAYI